MKQRGDGGRGSKRIREGGASVIADKRKRGSRNLIWSNSSALITSAGGAWNVARRRSNVRRRGDGSGSARLASRRFPPLENSFNVAMSQAGIGLVGLVPSSHGNSRRNWAYLNSRLDYPPDLDKWGDSISYLFELAGD